MRRWYLTPLFASLGVIAIAALAQSQPAPVPTLSGRQVFERNCAACHGAGNFMPGTVALATRYAGSEPGPLEQRKDLDRASITYFVRNGVTIMPGFRKSEISDAELDALADYLTKKEVKAPR